MITVQEYDLIKIKGLEASQYVSGTERGGFVLSGQFYYSAATNIGIHSVPAKDYKLTRDFGASEQEMDALYQNKANEG